MEMEKLPAVLLGASAASKEAALLKPLAELVKTTLDSACRSKHSRRSYEQAIGNFLAFLGKTRGALLPSDLQSSWLPFAKYIAVSRDQKIWKYNGPSVILRLADASIISGFKAFLETEGKDSANTVAARISAVRTLLSIAYRDGVVTSDQAAVMGVSIYRLKIKRDEKPVGRRLSEDEVRSLQAATDASSIKGKRDAAVIDCLLYLALRAEELCELRLSSFYLDKGFWWIQIKGKGKKTRRVKVNAQLMETLLPWIEISSPGLGNSAEYLFRSITKGGTINDTSLDTSAIARIVAQYGFRAGIAPESGPNMLSPHDLRRTAARDAYDRGASLLKVQHFLGHSDVKTTIRYIGAYDEDERPASDYLSWRVKKA